MPALVESLDRYLRAKRIGRYHAIVNVTAMVLFALSLWLRWDTPETPATTALLLSFAGVVLALVGGWFGGELVERLGVGVAENANLNAPNSLTQPDRNELRVDKTVRHATR